MGGAAGRGVPDLVSICLTSHHMDSPMDRQRQRVSEVRRQAIEESFGAAFSGSPMKGALTDDDEFLAREYNGADSILVEEAAQPRRPELLEWLLGPVGSLDTVYLLSQNVLAQIAGAEESCRDWF